MRMLQRQIHRSGRAVALAAVLYATLGVHALHPFLHRDGRGTCAQDSHSRHARAAHGGRAGAPGPHAWLLHRASCAICAFLAQKRSLVPEAVGSPPLTGQWGEPAALVPPEAPHAAPLGLSFPRAPPSLTG